MLDGCVDDLDHVLSEPVVHTLSELALLGCQDSLAALRNLRLVNRTLYRSVSIIFTPHLLRVNRRCMLGAHHKHTSTQPHNHTRTQLTPGHLSHRSL